MPSRLKEYKCSLDIPECTGTLNLLQALGNVVSLSEKTFQYINNLAPSSAVF